MTEFSYTAVASDGSQQRGVLHATSEHAARQQLTKREMTVTEIRAVGMPWTSTEDDRPAAVATMEEPYAPLLDTLRIFSGWLLAWYGLVFMIGSLRQEGSITMDIPVVDALFASSLLLRITFGTFLFLVLTSLHAWTGRGIAKGILLTIVWVAVVALFVLNT